MHTGLFQALGESKHVYLSSKLPMEQNYLLSDIRSQIVETFEQEEIVDLPLEHHLTRCFLGTKNAEQLQDFYAQLFRVRPSLSKGQIVFDRVGWFRSFVNNRPIIFLQPASNNDRERMVKFWQALRMEEWNPQADINSFSPHITLAQLSEDVTDELVANFVMQHSSISHQITPGIDSLFFHAKQDHTKISIQVDLPEGLAKP